MHEPVSRSNLFFQPKLTVNTPDDPYEKEADAMADKVMRMETPSVQPEPIPVTVLQRKCAHCEEEENELQRKEMNGEELTPDGTLENYVSSLDGGGESLPNNVRNFYEPRFGYDFSHVKVHTDAVAAKSAQSINSLAYTTGNHIVFNEGQYSFDSGSGKRLLGHELTHVVQQGNNVQTKKIQRQEERMSSRVFRRRLRQLELDGTITSEEARYMRNHIPARSERARRIRQLQARAAAFRSSRGHRLISNFDVTPRVIRVSQGESARISFRVNGSDIQSIDCYIVKHEFDSEEPSARFFTFRANTPGHKVAIWDGTFDGSRNRPPETGTYRVRVSVRSASGRQENMFEQIRVENPRAETVLPRTESGLDTNLLTFNGSVAILFDTRGNSITAQALSGLKPNNPHNHTHIDYTLPSYQADRDHGPIPAGIYYINPNAVQQPDYNRGRLRYPTGAGARGWGPFRVPLVPAPGTNTLGRSEFFFHLDTNNDGTAGCIGIQRGDEGKFNQMAALLMRIPPGSLVVVHVRYP